MGNRLPPGEGRIRVLLCLWAAGQYVSTSTLKTVTQVGDKNILIRMDHNHLIERRSHGSGLQSRITMKGVNFLRSNPLTAKVARDLNLKVPDADDVAGWNKQKQIGCQNDSPIVMAAKVLLEKLAEGDRAAGREFVEMLRDMQAEIRSLRDRVAAAEAKYEAVLAQRQTA